MPAWRQVRRLFQITLLAALGAVTLGVVSGETSQADQGQDVWMAPAPYVYDVPVHVAAPAHDAHPAFTTPTANLRTDASGMRSAPRTSPGAVRVVSGYGRATKPGSRLDRLKVRLADETGAVGRYGNLGNLSSRADEALADVIRSRGGGASQLRQLQTGYGQRTLGELSDLAASGDREAVRAIKMAKQAGSQGKGGR